MFNCLHTNSSCLLVQWVSVLMIQNSPASPLLEGSPQLSSHDPECHHLKICDSSKPECWQCVKICGPSKGSSVFGTTKSHRTIPGKYVWWSSFTDVWPWNFQNRKHIVRGHCYKARSKHQIEVHVSPSNIILPCQYLKQQCLLMLISFWKLLVRSWFTDYKLFLFMKSPGFFLVLFYFSYNYVSFVCSCYYCIIFLQLIRVVYI